MEGAYKLNEIFDVTGLQDLCNSISNLHDIATGIMDLEGNIVVSSGFSFNCSCFRRDNTKSFEQCICSDKILSNTSENEKYKIYTCPCGFTNVSMPT